MYMCVGGIDFVSTISKWFSPGTPVSFTNKTDLHDIAEILLKVALNSIPPPLPRWLFRQCGIFIFGFSFLNYYFYFYQHGLAFALNSIKIFNYNGINLLKTYSWFLV